jgi:hypothetical protein
MENTVRKTLGEIKVYISLAALQTPRSLEFSLLNLLDDLSRVSAPLACHQDAESLATAAEASGCQARSSRGSVTIGEALGARQRLDGDARVSSQPKL